MPSGGHGDRVEGLEDQSCSGGQTSAGAQQAAGGWDEEAGSGFWQTRIQILVPPNTSCVTLGKAFGLSKLFLHLPVNEDNYRNTYLLGCYND